MPDPTRNDWDLAAQAVAAESERLAAENARLRCQVEQAGLQEMKWESMRPLQVTGLEFALPGSAEKRVREADERVCRAKSVTVFWILVAAIFAAASVAQAIYIFRVMR